MSTLAQTEDVIAEDIAKKGKYIHNTTKGTRKKEKSAPVQSTPANPSSFSKITVSKCSDMHNLGQSPAMKTNRNDLNNATNLSKYEEELDMFTLEPLHTSESDDLFENDDGLVSSFSELQIERDGKDQEEDSGSDCAKDTSIAEGRHLLNTVDRLGQERGKDCQMTLEVDLTDPNNFSSIVTQQSRSCLLSAENDKENKGSSFLSQSEVLHVRQSNKGLLCDISGQANNVVPEEFENLSLNDLPTFSVGSQDAKHQLCNEDEDIISFSELPSFREGVEKLTSVCEKSDGFHLSDDENSNGNSDTSSCHERNIDPDDMDSIEQISSDDFSKYVSIHDSPNVSMHQQKTSHSETNIKKTSELEGQALQLNFSDDENNLHLSFSEECAQNLEYAPSTTDLVKEYRLDYKLSSQSNPKADDSSREDLKRIEILSVAQSSKAYSNFIKDLKSQRSCAVSLNEDGSKCLNNSDDSVAQEGQLLEEQELRFSGMSVCFGDFKAYYISLSKNGKISLEKRQALVKLIFKGGKDCVLLINISYCVSSSVII